MEKPRAYSDQALPARSGPVMPAFARGVLLGGAWLPSFALIIFYLPSFAPIFAKLAEKGELPTLTIWLLALARMNAATFGLPMLALLALVIFADIGIARATASRRRGTLLYWSWFAAIILSALVACLLFVIAVLAPVYRMSSTID